MGWEGRLAERFMKREEGEKPVEQREAIGCEFREEGMVYQNKDNYTGNKFLSDYFPMGCDETPENDFENGEICPIYDTRMEIILGFLNGVLNSVSNLTEKLEESFNDSLKDKIEE